MASTADCKTLLANAPELAGRGSEWKRLTKYNSEAGAVRIFANQAQDCFVRVLETQSGELLVDAVGDTQAAVDAKASLGPKEAMATVDLFALFPPDFDISDEELDELEKTREEYRSYFSGRLVYSFDNSEDEGDIVCFAMGYETKEGWLYDQHCGRAYEEILQRAFPEEADRVGANESEATHSFELDEDFSFKKAMALMTKRFKALGIVDMKSPSMPHPKLPVSDAVFAARAIDDPETFDTLVQLTAFGGVEIIVLDWHQRSESEQAALQAWAAGQGHRLASMPDRNGSSAFDIGEIEVLAVDGILVAKNGAFLMNIGEIGPILAGVPSKARPARKP